MSSGCKFYQIVVYGRMACFERAGMISSQTIFRTKAEADAATESFKTTCTTPLDDLDMSYLDPEWGVVAKVVELEVSGESSSEIGA